MPPHIRVTASTVVIRGGRLLLIQFQDEDGIYYKLPGGGVDRGETVEAAAQREAWEEAQAQVEVGRLLLVYEYEPKSQYNRYGARHKLGLVFEGRLQPHSQPQMPHHPDKNQIGVDWVPLEKLHRVPLRPRITDALLDALDGAPVVLLSNL